MPSRPSSNSPESPALSWDVSLEIVRGEARHRVRQVESSAFLIGAADDCDLVLRDPQFSEVHACLMVKDDGVWLRHLGFSPELTVSGKKIGRIRLQDGDSIRTGPFELAVTVKQRQPAKVARPHFATGPYRALRSTPDDRSTAVAEVRSLLADIREELAVAGPRARLYQTPEEAAALMLRTPRITARAFKLRTRRGA